MPFSLAATTHIFTKTADGGIQQVVAKKTTDTAQAQMIRQHLQEIQAQFLKGTTPDRPISTGKTCLA